MTSELERTLTCDDRAYGFVHAHCTQCGQDELVDFSVTKLRPRRAATSTSLGGVFVWWAPIAAAIGTALLAAACGLLASAQALAARPIETLRC